MDNLQDLGFIFAIIFGFIALPFFREFLLLKTGVNSRGKNSILNNASNKYTLITLFILFLFSILFFLIGFFFESNYVYVIKEWNFFIFYFLSISSMLVDFFIGLLIGFFAKSVYEYLSMGHGRILDKFAFVVRVVPIVLLFAIGVFRDDLRSIFKDAQRIDTPYISLQFNKTSETKSKIWYERESKTTQTLFEAGVRAFLAAAHAPFTDLNKISSFCNEKFRVKCDLPETNFEYVIADKDIEDLRESNQELKGEKGFKYEDNALEYFKASKDYNLDNYLYYKILFYQISGNKDTFDVHRVLRSGNTFSDSLSFSFNIHRLSQCIKEFKGRFPNGVPIIEEISEIAADYTMSDIRAVDNVEDLPRYDHQIEVILKRIVDGGRVATDEKKVDQGEDQSDIKCEMLSIEQKKLLRDMLFIHFKYLWHSKKLRKNDVELDVLPYRAIFDASTLLMAGYAVEAARYLDHKLVQFDKQNSVTSSELGFADFLFRLQLLTHIDGLYEFAAKKQSVPLFREQWPDRLESVMNHVSEWFVVNTNLNSFELGDLMKSCAGNDLHFINLNDESAYVRKGRKLIYNGAVKNEYTALQQSFSGSSKEEILIKYDKYLNYNKIPKKYKWGELRESDYIKKMIHFYIEKYYSFVGAVAGKGAGITNIHTEKAIELLSVSIEKSNAIFSCYRKNRKKALKVRAMLAFAAGELFAFYAQQLQQEEVLQETLRLLEPSDSKSKEFACLADLALRFALKTNEDLESHIKSLTEPEVNPIEGEAARARTMLTRISLKQCDAFEAHRSFLKLAS